MFHLIKDDNRLEPLTERSFTELGLKERQHLQEWIAKQPSALGEELLVIQKEFAGFADTRERLDLLALDKQGQLVVIENKLDDSGRDVTWQALKYAAYVSSLTKSQIVDIYQRYLDTHHGGGAAQRKICEFLEVDDLDELALNPGYDQRIIFVAANFRKEVTATVLWLREHRIDARCFKITPYSFGGETFVQIQPVIPTPEAAEFMISMAEKESEEKTAASLQRRHKLRLEFWALALDALRQNGLKRYESLSPSKDNWISCGSGVTGVQFVLSFTQSVARAAVVINSSDKALNKQRFDQLHAQRQEIEAAFGGPLIWSRQDEAKQSQISVEQPFDGFNPDEWPDMAEWMADNMDRLQKAFERPLSALKAGPQ